MNQLSKYLKQYFNDELNRCIQNDPNANSPSVTNKTFKNKNNKTKIKTANKSLIADQESLQRLKINLEQIKKDNNIVKIFNLDQCMNDEFKEAREKKTLRISYPESADVLIFFISEKSLIEGCYHKNALDELIEPWTWGETQSKMIKLGILFSSSRKMMEKCQNYFDRTFQLSWPIIPVSDNIFLAKETNSNNQSSSISYPYSLSQKNQMAQIIKLLEGVQGHNGQGLPIPRIHSKGIHANQVFNYFVNNYKKNRLTRLKSEDSANAFTSRINLNSPSNSTQKNMIDLLIILSRDVDYLSAFQNTRYNYYTDHLFEIDPDYILDQYLPNKSRKNSENGQETKKETSLINLETDLDSVEIQLGKLSKIIRNLKNKNEGKDITIDNMKDIIEQLKDLNINSTLPEIQLHRKYINEIRGRSLDYLVHFEKSILDGQHQTSDASTSEKSLKSQLSTLSNMIVNEMYSFNQLLRVFILITQTHQLSKNQMDQIFKDFVNTFGYNVLSKLNECKRNNFFTQASSFSRTVKSTSIFNKLVTTCCNPGWNSNEISKFLSKIPGKHLFLEEDEAGINSVDGRLNVVVMSLGGVRMSEINQLEEISRKSNLNFYHVTSGVICCDSLLNLGYEH